MKIYSASYRCNASIFTALIALFQQAMTYRWQIWLAIKKKIHATYQQDVFGLFWSIVMPIIPMTVYMVLAQIKVFKTVDDMPFIYYIAMGMFVWLIMATTIHTVILSIKAEKSILTTTNFPIFATMLSQVGEVLHDSAIRLIVVAFIVVWYSIDITLGSLLLALLSLIPAILFAFGLGMLMSMLDVVVQVIAQPERDSLRGLGGPPPAEEGECTLPQRQGHKAQPDERQNAKPSLPQDVVHQIAQQQRLARPQYRRQTHAGHRPQVSQAEAGQHAPKSNQPVV